MKTLGLGVALLSSILSLSAASASFEITYVDEDGAGAFRVMVHGSAWEAAALQTALQALGATVGANNYDASGATATGFTY